MGYIKSGTERSPRNKRSMQKEGERHKKAR